MALNEADNLPRLFSDLEAQQQPFPDGSRMMVVDDGSADGTPAFVEAYAGPLPVQLVRLEQNHCPGAAFRAGFAAALDHAEDEAFIATLEADTTGDIDSLPAMLERAAAGAELVPKLAERRFGRPSAPGRAGVGAVSTSRTRRRPSL
jgi:glycosyltransferase involved in cell wall biosynthesis